MTAKLDGHAIFGMRVSMCTAETDGKRITSVTGLLTGLYGVEFTGNIRQSPVGILHQPYRAGMRHVE